MAVADQKVEPLTWRVHPARERVGATVFALAVVGGMVWMVGEIMENPWWGLLPAGFFLVTLQRFFLPSEFCIDEDGVTAKFTFTSLKYAWKEIRRFQHDGRGAFLSTRRCPSLFDSFRGMHLMFADNREQVIERIESQMNRGT